MDNVLKPTTHAGSAAQAADAFDELIASREANVGIVGLGYAGLPLAIAFADAGFDVTGLDTYSLFFLFAAFGRIAF